MAKAIKKEIFVEFDLCNKTEIATRLAREARKARKLGEMKLILGKSGVGKTKAIQSYIQEDEDVIYVLCRRGMRKNRFMKAIAEKLGIKKKMTYDDYVDAIVDNLKDTSTLLIIDEPEHITIEAVEGIRYINELTNVGVLFVGLPEFYNYIKGHRRDFEYVYNRLGVTYHAKELKAKDFEKLLEGVLPIEYAGILHELSGQNTRFLRKIVQNAKIYAIENAIAFNDIDKMEKIFKTAAEELDVKTRLK